MVEEWRDIPGFEGSYQVSNHGQVRSVERTICTSRGMCKTWPSIMMNQYTHWKGYKTIYLRLPGVKKKFFVHRLVAIAFIEDFEHKPIVNHKDLNKGNNHLSNLEMMTDSENVRHALEAREKANAEPF